jgi:hypothetical protein
MKTCRSQRLPRRRNPVECLRARNARTVLWLRFGSFRARQTGCVLRPVKVREPNVKGLLHRNPLNLAACESVKGIVQTNYIGDLVIVSTVSLIYKGFYSKPFTPSPASKIKAL